MTFSIQEPDHELSIGYLTIVIKYIVLFIVSWIGAWLVFLFVPIGGVHTVSARWTSILFLHPTGLSILFAIGVIGSYSLKLYKRAKYGLLKSITFNEDTIEMILFNEINGKSRARTVPISSFQIRFKKENHILFGQQRLFDVFDGGQKVTSLNIDKTAWCRHPKVEVLISALKKCENELSM